MAYARADQLKAISYQVFLLCLSVYVLLVGCLKLKAQSAFLAAFLASILMLVVGSIWVLLFEQAGQGNLNNGADALWWAVTTMTTVGYGDYYPVTTGGRVIAAMLMVTGVGLFGSFTGFVASWLVEDELEEDQQQLNEMHEEIIRLREAVERLSRKLEAD